MATTGKILGQVSPAVANTDNNLYAVPGATQAQVARLLIVNYGASVAKATVWLRVNGAVKTNAQIVVYPGAAGTVPVGQRQKIDDNYTLNAGDIVTVQSDTANTLSFTLLGLEIA
jgi:hypothetical protein